MIRTTAAAIFTLLASTSLTAAQSEVEEAIAEFSMAPGFELVDVSELESTLADLWLDTSTPGGAVGPIEKALLIAESAIPGTRTRTELSYGQMLEEDDAGSVAPVSFIEVRHFNIGATLRAELAGDLGDENVADASEFGEGENRAWRFVFRPLMGNTATLIEASSKIITAKDASKQDCRGTPCLASYRDFEEVASWKEVGGDLPAWPEEYPAIVEEVTTPAYAASRLAALGFWANAESGAYQWTYGEHPEGVERYEMYRFLSIDRNLGNESGLDALWQETRLNDDAVTALLYRYTDIAGFITMFTASEGR